VVATEFVSYSLSKVALFLFEAAMKCSKFAGFSGIRIRHLLGHLNGTSMRLDLSGNPNPI
jgi:hypothetical protein